MRFSRLFFFFALLLALSPLPAKAEVVLGKTCETLGASMMTSDQQDIATCLKDTSGKLIWKGMTKTAGNGNLCGIVVASYSSSSKRPYTTYSLSQIQQCEGQNILSPSYGYGGNKFLSSTITGVQANCPAGYALKGFTYASESHSNNADKVVNSATLSSGSSVYFCAAQ